MNIGSFEVMLGANTAGLSRAAVNMRRFETQVMASNARIQSSFATLASQLMLTGTMFTQYITVPLALLGGLATKSFMSYERTLQQIVGLNGIAAKTTREWGNEMLAISKTTLQGPQQLAEGLKFITGSGITGAESMDVLKKSSMGATAGLGDVQTIAKAATGAILAYGNSTMSAQRAVNTFLLTIREGVGAPQEFVAQMGGMFQIAAKVGVPIEEVGAALAALTQQGVSAAEAETQVKAFLRALVQQEPMAEKALEDLGLSFGQLLKSIKSGGLMSAFTLIDSAVKKFTDSSEREDKVLGDVFQNVRALLPVFALLGDKLSQTQAIFDRIKAPGDQLTKAFNLNVGGAWGKWEASVQKIKTSFIELGGVLSGPILKIVQDFTSVIARLINWFTELDKSKQRTVLMFALIGAAIGPVSLVLGQVVGMVKIFISLMGVAGGWVTLFLGIAYALRVVYKNWDVFEKAIDNFNLKQALQNIGEVIFSTLTPGINSMQKSWNEFAKTIKGSEQYQNELIAKQKEYNDLVTDLSSATDTIAANTLHEQLLKNLTEQYNLRKKILAIKEGPKSVKNTGLIDMAGNLYDRAKWGVLSQNLAVEVKDVFNKVQKQIAGDDTVSIGQMFANQIKEDLGAIGSYMNDAMRGLTGIDVSKWMNDFSNSISGGFNLGTEEPLKPILTDLKYYTRVVEDLPMLENYLPGSEAAALLTQTTKKLQENGDMAAKMGYQYDETGKAVEILKTQLEKLNDPAVIGKMNPQQIEDFKTMIISRLSYLELYEKKQIDVDKIMIDTDIKMRKNALSAGILGKSFDLASRNVSTLSSAIATLSDPEVLTSDQMTPDKLMWLQQQIELFQYWQSQIDYTSKRLTAMRSIYSNLGSMVGTVSQYMSKSFQDFFNKVQSGIQFISSLIGLIKAIGDMTKINTIAQQGANAANAAGVAPILAVAGAEEVKAAASEHAAIAGAASSNSWIPIVGVALAIAGIASMIVAMSNGRKKMAKMAKGGIVPDGFPNDTFPAMLSSKETVIPLNKMGEITRNNVETKDKQVIFRIHRKELVGILEDAQLMNLSY